MRWKIVCDSSCDLLEKDFSSDCTAFETVPLRIRVGEHEFLDNEYLNTSMLLSEMAAADSSTTACPSPSAFANAFSDADCVLCFTISANLSGTYNAACMGQELTMEQCPDKQICVIDSKSTAGAMVLLAQKAVELIRLGLDFSDICRDLRIYQASLRTVFTLENFDNLIKNGRMRPLVGTLLRTLGIHVIAEASPQGTIRVSGKARGEKKTYQAMADHMAVSKDCTDAEVMISHCNNLTGALKLKEQILTALPVRSVRILSCRGLTTFYAMDKGLIVGY